MLIQHFSSINTRNNARSTSKVLHIGKYLNLYLSNKWGKLFFMVSVSSNSHPHINRPSCPLSGEIKQETTLYDSILN